MINYEPEVSRFFRKYENIETDEEWCKLAADVAKFTDPDAHERITVAVEYIHQKYLERVDNDANNLFNG